MAAGCPADVCRGACQACGFISPLRRALRRVFAYPPPSPGGAEGCLLPPLGIPPSAPTRCCQPAPLLRRKSFFFSFFHPTCCRESGVIVAVLLFLTQAHVKMTRKLRLLKMISFFCYIILFFIINTLPLLWVNIHVRHLCKHHDLDLRTMTQRSKGLKPAPSVGASASVCVFTSNCSSAGVSCRG